MLQTLILARFYFSSSSYAVFLLAAREQIRGTDLSGSYSPSVYILHAGKYECVFCLPPVRDSSCSTFLISCTCARANLSTSTVFHDIIQTSCRITGTIVPRRSFEEKSIDELRASILSFQLGRSVSAVATPRRPFTLRRNPYQAH